MGSENFSDPCNTKEMSTKDDKADSVQDNIVSEGPATPNVEETPKNTTEGKGNTEDGTQTEVRPGVWGGRLRPHTGGRGRPELGGECDT